MTPLEPAPREKFLACAAFVVAAFGIKLWFIARFGNATPFWDEWDALAANLFVPYRDGTLTWGQLLAPHNEHRILTVRLVSLALFEANGGWDPLLQMVLNAAIHVAAGICVLLILGRNLDRVAFAVLLALTTVLIATPNASESVLMGQQTSFYCFLLFGLLAIVFFMRPSFWAPIPGFGAFALSFFCLSSAALELVASATVLIARRVLGAEQGRRAWILAAILLGGFVVALLVTPTVEGHRVLRAGSVGEFVSGLFLAASWPLRRPAFVGALVVNAPLLLLGWRVLRNPPPASDKSWIVLALGLWLGAQYAAIAFSRAQGITASRYVDFNALGILVNFVAATMVVEGRRSRCALIAWVTVIAVGFALQTARHVPNELRMRHDTAAREESNVRSFLTTGAFLPGASGADLSLPYPDANRLALLLSDSRVRAILPTPFQEHPPRDRLQPLRDALLAAGPFLAIAGAFGVLLMMWRVLFARAATAGPPES